VVTVMSRGIPAVVLLSLGLMLAVGCEKGAAPPPTPSAPMESPKPAAPPPKADAGPPKPKMVANPDGLSLAERIAKRQATEKKLAVELAAQEHDRLLKYDQSKLPLHIQVFTFIGKTRAQYDALEKKLAGAADKEKAKAEIEKLAGTLRKPIEAMGKKMATIDPKGGNSNVTTDYDVMLNALANDYPSALASSVDGAENTLKDQKAELDKRTKKITAWIAELKAKK
jgi:hypothetical protein